MPVMVRTFTRTRQSRREGSIFSQESARAARATEPEGIQRISTEAGCCPTVFFTIGLITIVGGAVLLIIGVSGPTSTSTYTAFAISGGVILGLGVVILVSSIIYSKKTRPISVQPSQNDPGEEVRDERTDKKHEKKKKKLRKSRKELDMETKAQLEDDGSVTSIESDTQPKGKHLGNLPPLTGTKNMLTGQRATDGLDSGNNGYQMELNHQNNSHTAHPYYNESFGETLAENPTIETHKPPVYQEKMTQGHAHPSEIPAYYGVPEYDGQNAHEGVPNVTHHEPLDPSSQRDYFADMEQNEYEEERKLYTPGPRMQAPPPPVYDAGVNM